MGMYCGTSTLVTSWFFLAYHLLYREESPQDAPDDDHMQTDGNNGGGGSPLLLHRVDDRDRLGRQYERRKLGRIQKVIDIAGNRLPRRFINDLGKQLGLSCLIPSVQLRR